MYLIFASHRTLTIIAALFWYVGGLVLFAKGAGLLWEAKSLKPYAFWPWAAAVAALLIGGLKARFLFAPSCRQNMIRISALNQPRIWQFFKPVFFMLLFTMILAGIILSSLSHGNYPLLLGLATLDLSIATALFGSSYVFWR